MEFLLPGVSDLINLGLIVFTYWKTKKMKKQENEFRHQFLKLLRGCFDIDHQGMQIRGLKENILEKIFSGFRIYLGLKEYYVHFDHGATLVKGKVYRVFKLKGMKTKKLKYFLEEDLQEEISDFMFEEVKKQVEFALGFVKFEEHGYRLSSKIKEVIQEIRLEETDFKYLVKEYTSLSEGIPWPPCRIEYLFLPPLSDHNYFRNIRKIVSPILIDLYNDPTIKKKLEIEIEEYLTKIFNIKLGEKEIEMTQSLQDSIRTNITIFLDYIGDQLDTSGFASWWVHYFDPNSVYYKEPFTRMTYQI